TRFSPHPASARARSARSGRVARGITESGRDRRGAEIALEERGGVRVPSHELAEEPLRVVAVASREDRVDVCAPGPEVEDALAQESAEHVRLEDFGPEIAVVASGVAPTEEVRERGQDVQVRERGIRAELEEPLAREVHRALRGRVAPTRVLEVQREVHRA